MVRCLSLVAMALLASGCGASRYCLVEQEYQRAAIAPDLQPVEGLSLPESPSALRLPPAPAKNVPFGTEGPEGEGVCLDKPPRMAAPASSPAPATPAAS